MTSNTVQSQNETKSRSAALYERAKISLPGGVSRNTVLQSPHPYYADRAVGSRVIDIDGVERIDFANNMASLIHGHSHPAIVAAVTEQLAKGTAFTLATEVEIDFAEHMCGRSPGFDQVRFVNSGTEAVMGALKAARAFTGRPKIAKVEGAYHGLYDFAEVSQTANPSNWGDPDQPASVPVSFGTPESVLADVVIIPFNDPETAIEILDAHRSTLACVLVDPMPHRAGVIPASPAFIDALRTWTEANGALLVFDEVITFRTEVGGFQQRYGVSPDLTAMGKLLGGGFPVGAIAGRRDVMQVMNPLTDKVLFPHSGTFSANPITMTAGLTAMELFDAEAVKTLNELTERAMQGIREAIARTGAEACVTGAGSMFKVHFRTHPPTNYREAFEDSQQVAARTAMLRHLFDEGFMMVNSCSALLSTVMNNDDVDALVAAFESGFMKMNA